MYSILHPMENITSFNMERFIDDKILLQKVFDALFISFVNYYIIKYYPLKWREYFFSDPVKMIGTHFY